MTDNNTTSMELEQMRQQMQELKTVLHEQRIVNEQVMRRAMKSDYRGLRSDLWVSIVMVIVIVPFAWLRMPLFGMPTWFTITTIVFFLVAMGASLFSLHRYASDDLLTGNLTTVAGKMVAYRRFNNRWLCFSIPFLVFWMVCFFYFLAIHMEVSYFRETVTGGIIGAIVGIMLGTMQYKRFKRQVARILQQIEEVNNKNE